MARSRVKTNHKRRPPHENGVVKKIEKELKELDTDVPPIRVIFNRRYESDAS